MAANLTRAMRFGCINIFVAALVSVAPMFLAAQATMKPTGREILPKCEAIVSVWDGVTPSILTYQSGAFCMGFVTANLDVMEGTDGVACVGYPTTLGSIVRIFVGYLRSHRRILGNDASRLFWSAMDAALPCTNVRPTKE